MMLNGLIELTLRAFGLKSMVSIVLSLVCMVSSSLGAGIEFSRPKSEITFKVQDQGSLVVRPVTYSLDYCGCRGEFPGEIDVQPGMIIFFEPGLSSFDIRAVIEWFCHRGIPLTLKFPELIDYSASSALARFLLISLAERSYTYLISHGSLTVNFLGNDTSDCWDFE